MYTPGPADHRFVFYLSPWVRELLFRRKDYLFREKVEFLKTSFPCLWNRHFDSLWEDLLRP